MLLLIVLRKDAKVGTRQRGRLLWPAGTAHGLEEVGHDVSLAGRCRGGRCSGCAKVPSSGADGVEYEGTGAILGEGSTCEDDVARLRELLRRDVTEDDDDQEAIVRRPRCWVQQGVCVCASLALTRPPCSL